MENYLTKNEMKVFEKNEDGLIRVLSGILRPFPSKYASEMEGIYELKTGNILRNWGCGSCALKNWKKIAKLYFASKEHYKNLEEEQKAKENNKVENKTNKKVGRPKKNVKDEK